MSSGENERLAGRYRVVRRLGRGGMGVVWHAVDEVLGREVAVKELRTYTDTAAGELADLRLRMTREARAAARVRHPGVVAVHDVTEHEGRPVIVMELVDGPSLDDVLKERGALEPLEAARIGAAVLEALAAAHDAGVLHRDVKPGNILLDRSGRTVLTDFGIAAMEDPGDGSATRLTRSGEIIGSLDFLAPERARGADPAPAADVWAVGATLYAAVEGSSPFRRTSTWSTLAAIVADPLPEPRCAGPLTPVLLRLLDKDPATRPDAREAARLLAALADPAATAAAGPPEVPRPAGAFGPPVPPVPAGPAVPPPPVVPAVTVPPGRARRGKPARRANALVVASAAAVLLAGGGITYALMDRDDAAPRAADSSSGTAGGGTDGASGTAGDPGRVLDPGSDATPASAPPGTGPSSAAPDGRATRSGDAAGGAASSGGDARDGGAGTDSGGSGAATTSGGGTDTAAGGGSGGRTGGATATTGTGDGASTTGSGAGGTTGGGATTAPAAGATTTAAPAPTTQAPAGGCEAAGSGSTCQVVRSATTKRHDGGEMGTVGVGPHLFFCQVDLAHSESYGGVSSRWFARTDDDSGNTNVYLSVLHLRGGASGGPVEGLRIC
ncbi:serine/threonine-protein kinase [Streptomyces hydrogenans]|uniref:serine/threonine-protein kinase n=1 Tax=Streptomyces hydrogenans TaxID=1873719 RepID=UPI00339FFA3A